METVMLMTNGKGTYVYKKKLRGDVCRLNYTKKWCSSDSNQKTILPVLFTIKYVEMRISFKYKSFRILNVPHTSQKLN